ncbi:MAG: NAD(P)/FAD-dependent oxidoreductase [Erythrobacter sp.]
MKRWQVIIAGAGPVGTVAAQFLVQRGISVLLLEAGNECAADLRASTFHPPTLVMLDELGITEKLIEKGLKAPIYHFRERQTGEVIEFDLSELEGQTKYPFRIQCEQYHLSRMLSEAIGKEENATVLFGHRLVHFDQDEGGVTVNVDTGTKIETHECDYLIGADGANSMVRKWLGTEFDGFTYPEKFLCLTTKVELADHIENLAFVNYVSDPNEWMVLLRVPSLWRILVPADPNATDEELTSEAKKNQVFDDLIGNGADVQTEHRTIYRVHQRVAKSFREGRVAIIGDAAHLNNPLGGFGMNSGIHDAFSLGEKLVRIIRGGEPADPLLSQYDAERRKITHDFIQAQTIQNMEYMKGGEASQHELRKASMQATRENSASRKAFLLKQSMIDCLKLANTA